MFPPQPERVAHHEDAREGHGRGGEHGQQAAQHGHGDQHDVVDESPEQILVDGAQGGLAERDGGGHGGQVAADEGDVAGFDGDIAARADGEADIGLGQGGRVIDAVADHGHARAFRLQLLDGGGFIGRQDLGHDALDADLAGDGVRGLPVVAGDERHVQAAGLQGADSL